MDLQKIRKEIDRIDSEIIGFLSQRAKLVSMAGKLKKDEQAVSDPARVEQVIERVRKEAGETGLDPSIAEEVYGTITSCFINAELREFRERSGRGSDAIAIFKKNDLQLRPNVQGAMMWAVGLEKAMFTYFELAPNTVFPEHSHEAEQITFILEGELTFVYDNKEIVITEGDVIAIPSNYVHSVYTGDAPCKAVDAWSPVRKEYLEEKI